MSNLLIKNALIVTMDRQHRIIRDGGIAIQDGIIVDVDKTANIQSKFNADKTIDASENLVTPGLIDAHYHTALFLAKGLLDPSISIGSPAEQISFPYEKAMTRDDVRISALGSFIEMIKHGTTCFADLGSYHDHMGIVAKAMEETGIRGSIARACRDRRDSRHFIPDNMFESTKETLRKNEKLVKDWNGAANGLIKAQFGLRFSYNVSDELCRKAKELADKYQTGINGHAAYNKISNKESLELTGMREVQRYNNLGILDENLLLVHMGYVNKQEISLLRKYDVKVCHCPGSSVFVGYGNIISGMIPKMVQAGVVVALGSDAAEVGFLDMVRNAHLAATVHNEIQLKQNVIPVQKVMEMLTTDGAKALLWEDQIGSIEKGKRADVVLFDMRGMEWHPQIDPVSRLIFSADGSSVSTVIIDGKVIMENRRILTLNEEEIREAVDQSAIALRERIGLSPH